MSIKNRILSQSNQFNHYKEENEKLKKENKELKIELKNSEKFEEGISIIIPSYKGENHINPLLESLEKQTLSPNKYELIFIINGELDATINILKDFCEKNNDKNIIIAYTPTSNASHARNLGLRLAKREYTGFVDDDDFISPKYLEKLLEYSRPNRVVITNFIDIDMDTKEEKEPYLLSFSMKEHGILKEAPVKFLDLCAITQAKSIPTYATKSVKFNETLTSGEDISYYGSLYPKYDFEFYFINKKEEAIYYRSLRRGSISRKDMSFEFNVIDRLKVIGDLNSSYKNVSNEKYQKFLENCAKGQTGFIKRYLEKNSEDYEKVMEEVKKNNYEIFPYEILEALKKE